MPWAEYPFDGSWATGRQILCVIYRFRDVGMDFMFLVDTLHQNGIGVIMDWGTAHFRPMFCVAKFDDTAALYEHADPRQGFHQDWGTLIFNYGRNEVRGFLIASALAWCERYHIDGLQVDAVASMLYSDYSRKDGEWVPNQYGGRENLEAIDFLRQTNDVVHKYYPGTLMITWQPTFLVQTHFRRRSRFRPQVEHGLDERYARIFQEGLIHSESTLSSTFFWDALSIYSRISHTSLLA